MHTSMHAGSMIRKVHMKKADQRVRELNVDIGLECGLQGKAQIGKGMWAMLDLYGGDGRTENSSPSLRSEYCVGSFTHRRDATRPTLPPG